MYLNINHDKHIWPTKNRVNMRLFLHFLVFYPLQQVQITCDSYCSRDGTSTKGALMYPNHSEDDSNSFETPTPTRRGKKICSGIPEPLPLMEGQGKSLKVLGFSQNQRADFLQILMRFGVGDYDWKQFAPRIKHKSYEEITDFYCIPFSLWGELYDNRTHMNIKILAFNDKNVVYMYTQVTK
ncbi:CHD3-type chromatin-remodeling factor PICKLE-like isoform X11 [Vigna radiata var. radiata]|uniref:CHD3-type chromatin-remodeling factor PICKLE-like isoform X11 n=1 Tax=Vigna radiata var. radiata TaxID=3916 RepID=A0A3Q0FG10_VIGRR|nr:CHD3-type chromatin-remodeling factor PICKLE-like isoform X11 [Vigna radiata var. radiata]